MSTVFDHDAQTPHIEIILVKDGDILGLQAKDADGPDEYPTIGKIGRGTPIFNSPDIQLGDKIKSVNANWCKGKTKDFVHGIVRNAGTNGTIKLWVIKAFVQDQFVAQGSRIRKRSVFRTNPLLAVMAAAGEDISEADGN